MSKNTQGIIFDLDGTLIDSYQAIYLSFVYTYQNMGLQPLSYEAVKKVVGLGLSRTFRDLLGEERVPEALKLFRQKYDEVYRDNTYLLPGAREVLEALFKRGIRLGIATNKLGRFSRGIFQHFGLEHIFAVIVGDEDVSQNKPNPEMIFSALEKMNLPKENVIFVGDSLIDIQTGHNAAMRIFAIPTGVCAREELQKANPDRILEGLFDLLNCCEG
jgi:HAD superfamily hydrolase (TIGR01662 family)